MPSLTAKSDPKVKTKVKSTEENKSSGTDSKTVKPKVVTNQECLTALQHLKSDPKPLYLSEDKKLF